MVDHLSMVHHLPIVPIKKDIHHQITSILEVHPIEAISMQVHLFQIVPISMLLLLHIRPVLVVVQVVSVTDKMITMMIDH